MNERKKRGHKISVTCINCGEIFKKLFSQETYRKSRGSNGPFCGLSCAGLWNNKNKLK